MNEIECYILDDEQHAINAIKTYVEQTPFLKVSGASTNGFDALAALETKPFDLIFMDIHMPAISGLDLLKVIPKPVILTTAFSEHALDGFEHGVVDYLLKPVTYARFLKAAQKAALLIQSANSSKVVAADKQEKDFIFVKGEYKGKMIKISFREVDYIEASKNYVTFHCSLGKIMTSMNMKELERSLPLSIFLRIHNSYIVLLDRVAAIDGNQVVLKRRLNNEVVRLPIGATYKTNLMDAIS